ncbi:cytochrome c-type biogenesis CcmF C-terminal domain-containing protein, partial [Pseudomonas syringae group genomosp. 7]|uniref:cytochrome c-type biogenesis CcmF C-terminal domain-containing protein n=1 Tax=Pseudomonas syringae group genomosp. 7 TaxID=251699 RepID=UPI00376F74E9
LMARAPIIFAHLRPFRPFYHYHARYRHLQFVHQLRPFALQRRYGALLLNNLLLAVAAFVVFIGTIWPLVAEMLWDRRLSVGTPFFEKAFTPFM